MKKIVGIGETVLDMVFMDGQPKAAVPGGSVFNALVSLGRTLNPDIKVEMVSQIGRDHVAGIMLDFMKHNNVGSEHIILEEGKQSTVSMAMLDSKGDANYEFFREQTMPAFKPADIEFAPGDALLFGSFFAIDPETREQTRALAQKARNQGAEVYYDINFRKNHKMDIDALRAEVEKNIRIASVVRGSSEDIENIYGIDNAADAYNLKIKDLCPHFIYTRGGEPAEIFWNGAHYVHEVPPVNVVSTIGAGDNFNAGFIYGLLNELPLEKCIAQGVRFSGEVCSRMDNYVPEDFK